MRYVILFLFLFPEFLAAQTFTVIHVKRMLRDGQGTVEIGAEGIVYKAKIENHSRSWKYEDIQHFDRIGQQEFRILSYEDGFFGRDRSFRFLITDGEISEEVFRAVRDRLGKPVTNRVVPEIASPLYEVPVKHHHTLGGCEGVLKFTDDLIVYQTENAEDAREWRLDREIQSVSSMNPYHLEIRAYENNRREYSDTRVFRFSLKKPLDQDFFWKLKLKLYGLEK
jgi:hypothetical protein